MDLDVQNETQMVLLGRTDYKIRASYEGATPGRAALQGAIAKKLKGKKELVIIRRILPIFGNMQSIVEVSVYDSADALDRFEVAYVRKRHGAAEAKEAEASAAANEAATTEEAAAQETEAAEPAADGSEESAQDEQEGEEK